MLESADKPVPLPDSVRIPGADLMPAGTLLGLSLVFFLTPGWWWPIASRAAAGLLDVAPYVEAVLGR